MKAGLFRYKELPIKIHPNFYATRTKNKMPLESKRVDSKGNFFFKPLFYNGNFHHVGTMSAFQRHGCRVHYNIAYFNNTFVL